jgi:hypothetical protein
MKQSITKSLLFFFVFSLLFIIPAKSFAWGSKGHQIVAEIAFKYLDDSTKQKVKHYLRKISIDDAGTWMDDMRSNNYYDYMKPWHYMDLPKDSAYKPLEEGNILTALNTAIIAMRHKEKLKDSQIKQFILMAFHLLGDLHQPLHTGYPEDKGGNLVEINGPSYDGNLHNFWDTEIIEQKKINIDSCTQYYNIYTAADIAKIQHIDLLKWMYESRGYLGEVYNFKDNKVDQKYIDQNAILIEKQLLIAGLRLASVLKEMLG